jgi:hypothetical protein
MAAWPGSTLKASQTVLLSVCCNRRSAWDVMVHPSDHPSAQPEDWNGQSRDKAWYFTYIQSAESQRVLRNWNVWVRCFLLSWLMPLRPLMLKAANLLTAKFYSWNLLFFKYVCYTNKSALCKCKQSEPKTTLLVGWFNVHFHQYVTKKVSKTPERSAKFT